MSRIKICCIFVVLLIFSLIKISVSEEIAPNKPFAYAVISSAINMLPDNIKTYITPYESDIIDGAVIKQTNAKVNPEAVYYVNKRIGSGPKMLADQFKLVSSSIRSKTADKSIFTDMGRLTAYVISLSQPYHTDDAAYQSAAHKTFEQ